MLCCVDLHCVVLFVLCYPVFLCVVLYYVVWCIAVQYGVVRYGVVWCSVVWYGVVESRWFVVRCGAECSGMVWCGAECCGAV